MAKVASSHYALHERPFCLAIDISIWLFQIQSGKGGSNPALRTFYYRLLRLLSLNIHPLFVFDGPNKPRFKRNKKVGGPGIRVASVPEFLAKQLLKQFGFPWHVAPGEAEAECALLQREGIVDAVLSEDVDTLMFGSGVTLRNWSAENSNKTPTHVNLYRAEQTKAKSGLDREGMILVALMSGGDYVVEGIPGCGPKVACDAARAGFGKDLCDAARKKDVNELKLWRERLQFQIRTNEAKHFSRKNTTLTIPDDFPNKEVLGYYTHPCVSTPDKLAKLKDGLLWDREIDFIALRTFAADAFDWRCLGGAKKFIRNLAPAMLVRELRLRGDVNEELTEEARERREGEIVQALHGKRNHSTTDGELEYRISYTPANLVPIDLSIEEEDDQPLIAEGLEEQSDGEMESTNLPTSTQDVESAPMSPTKKRTLRPYDPLQPEKLWIIRDFLHTGCPLLVENYESSSRDPREVIEAARKARSAPKASKGKKKGNDMPRNALLAYAKVTKVAPGNANKLKPVQRQPLDILSAGSSTRNAKTPEDTETVVEEVSVFRLPSTQIPLELEQTRAQWSKTNGIAGVIGQATICKENEDPFTSTSDKQTKQPRSRRTPQRPKGQAQELFSPSLSQQTIESYWSPSRQQSTTLQMDIIDLISPPRAKALPRAQSPSPPRPKTQFTRTSKSLPEEEGDWSPRNLPDTITKRRRKMPLTRFLSAPVQGADEHCALFFEMTDRPATPEMIDHEVIDIIDLASPLSMQSCRSLPSPSDLRPELALRDIAKTATGSQLSLLQSPTEKAKGNSFISRAQSNATTMTVTSASQNHLPSMQESRGVQKAKKARIQIRESLPGTWRETEIEAVDLSGDGSGWKQSQGTASISGWRKSGIEVLDLTRA